MGSSASCDTPALVDCSTVAGGGDAYVAPGPAPAGNAQVGPGPIDSESYVAILRIMRMIALNPPRRNWSGNEGKQEDVFDKPRYPWFSIRTSGTRIAEQLYTARMTSRCRSDRIKPKIVAKMPAP